MDISKRIYVAMMTADSPLAVNVSSGNQSRCERIVTAPAWTTTVTVAVGRARSRRVRDLRRFQLFWARTAVICQAVRWLEAVPSLMKVASHTLGDVAVPEDGTGPFHPHHRR